MPFEARGSGNWASPCTLTEETDHFSPAVQVFHQGSFVCHCQDHWWSVSDSITKFSPEQDLVRTLAALRCTEAHRFIFIKHLSRSSTWFIWLNFQFCIIYIQFSSLYDWFSDRSGTVWASMAHRHHLFGRLETIPPLLSDDCHARKQFCWH